MSCITRAHAYHCRRGHDAEHYRRRTDRGKEQWYCLACRRMASEARKHGGSVERAPWTCKAGHGPEHYVRRADSGRWRCRVCQREKKRALRKKTETARRGCIVLREGRIGNGRIRRAVLAAMRRDPHLSYQEIAKRVGEDMDEAILTRGLGIRSSKKRGSESYARTISEERAVAILRAVHVDPWEVRL